MDKVMLEVLDPTGVEVEKTKKLAPRPDTLEGKRIGLIWNTKPNADVLLDEIGKLLKERYPTAQTVPSRITFVCIKLPPGELEAIAKNIDVAVFASGD